MDYIIRREQLSVLGLLGSCIHYIRGNCTEVQGFAVREQSAYRLSHHRSSLFTLVGWIGHSVLVGDADLARIHRIGIGADKLLQDRLYLLAGASGIRKYIHNSNNVFVMRKEDWIKVSDRLPEVNEDVLLAFIRHGEAEYFATVGYLTRARVKGLPTFNWNTEYEDEDMIITHWMPIELPAGD